MARREPQGLLLRVPLGGPNASIVGKKVQTRPGEMPSSFVCLATTSTVWLLFPEGGVCMCACVHVTQEDLPALYRSLNFLIFKIMFSLKLQNLY